MASVAGVGLLWPVADLRTFPFGCWQLDRVLLDRRCSIGGKMRGEAHFSPIGNSLFYHERGALVFGTHSGPAEQSYSYSFPHGRASASVRFRDGREFHQLDLSEGRSIVSHACGDDVYEGSFVALDETRWQSMWKVAGPRKDQEVRTLYTRLS